MTQIAASLVSARPEGLLLIAQSNAGLPQISGDGFAYTVDPAGMAAHAVELLQRIAANGPVRWPCFLIGIGRQFDGAPA